MIKMIIFLNIFSNIRKKPNILTTEIKRNLFQRDPFNFLQNYNFTLLIYIFNLLEGDSEYSYANYNIYSI